MKNQAKRQAGTKSNSNSKNKAALLQQERAQTSPNDNNNEQDFHTLNSSSPTQAAGVDHLRVSRLNLSDDDAISGSSGRGGSGFSSSDEENVSSSGSSSGRQLERANSHESLASPQSGRSSADDQTATTIDSLNGDDDDHQDNMKDSWTVVPARAEALALVDQVRVQFLQSLDDTESDKYDSLDLDELRKPLPSHTDGQIHQSLAIRYIGRYMLFDKLLAISQSSSSESAIEKALCEVTEKLRDFLQFRHHYQLNHVLVDQFCKEIYQLHGIFPFGHDKHNLPVLYLRARFHRRWSAPLDETFRRYVAWQLDMLTKSQHGAQVERSLSSKRNVKDGSFGICFDCLSMSYPCVDMDFLSFLVKVLVHYYPTYCRYALCVDLPWLFRSVWKLVRTWLPEEAQKTVHLITSKQLTEFIDEDQIPNSMKINELAGSKKSIRGKHKMPEEFDSLRNFDSFAQELNLSSSETKQFKSHMEKVIKEYQQLGAM